MSSALYNIQFIAVNFIYKSVSRINSTAVIPGKFVFQRFRLSTAFISTISFNIFYQFLSIYSENAYFSKDSESYNGSYLRTFEDGLTSNEYNLYGLDESAWTFEEMTVEQARAMYEELKAALE